VRRLFSTFAHGAPGVGLLLMRLVTGSGLIVHGVNALLRASPLAPALFQTVLAALGILLIFGLWTPVAGGLAAVAALWNVYSSGHPWRWIMLATVGAALALTGPGAWSIDAWLFGWRRLEIRDPTSLDSPSDE